MPIGNIEAQQGNTTSPSTLEARLGEQAPPSTLEARPEQKISPSTLEERKVTELDVTTAPPSQTVQPEVQRPFEWQPPKPTEVKTPIAAAAPPQETTPQGTTVSGKLPTITKDGKEYYDLEKIAWDAELSAQFIAEVPNGADILKTYRSKSWVPPYKVETSGAVAKFYLDWEKIIGYPELEQKTRLFLQASKNLTDAEIDAIFADAVRGEKRAEGVVAGQEPAKYNKYYFLSYQFTSTHPALTDADFMKAKEIFRANDGDIRKTIEQLKQTQPSVVGAEYYYDDEAAEFLANAVAGAAKKNADGTWDFGVYEDLDVVRAKIAELKSQSKELENKFFDLNLRLVQMIDPSATMETVMRRDISPNSYSDVSSFMYGKQYPDGINPAYKAIAASPELMAQFQDLMAQREQAANAMHATGNTAVALEGALISRLEPASFQSYEGFVPSEQELKNLIMQTSPVLIPYIKSGGGFNLQQAVKDGVDEALLFKLGFSTKDIENAKILNRIVYKADGSIDVPASKAAGLTDYDLKDIGITQEAIRFAEMLAEGTIKQNEKGEYYYDIPNVITAPPGKVEIDGFLFNVDDIDNLKKGSLELYTLLVTQGYTAYKSKIDELKQKYETQMAELAKLNQYKIEPGANEIALSTRILKQPTKYDLIQAYKDGYEASIRQVFGDEITDKVVVQVTALNKIEAYGGDIYKFLQSNPNDIQTLRDAGYTQRAIDDAMKYLNQPTVRKSDMEIFADALEKSALSQYDMDTINSIGYATVAKLISKGQFGGQGVGMIGSAVYDLSGIQRAYEANPRLKTLADNAVKSQLGMVTGQGKPPELSLSAFTSQFIEARGGAKDAEDLNRLSELAKLEYQRLYGITSGIASETTQLISGVIPVARALYPEVSIKDISGTEWAISVASVGLLAGGVMGAGGKIISTAGKFITGASIGTFPVVHGLEWKGLSTKERLMAIGSDALLIFLAAAPRVIKAVKKTTITKAGKAEALIGETGTVQTFGAKPFAEPRTGLALSAEVEAAMAELSRLKLARLNEWAKSAPDMQVIAKLNQQIKNVEIGLSKLQGVTGTPKGVFEQAQIKLRELEAARLRELNNPSPNQSILDAIDDEIRMVRQQIDRPSLLVVNKVSKETYKTKLEGADAAVKTTLDMVDPTLKPYYQSFTVSRNNLLRNLTDIEDLKALIKRLAKDITRETRIDVRDMLKSQKIQAEAKLSKLEAMTQGLEEQLYEAATRYVKKVEDSPFIITDKTKTTELEGLKRLPNDSIKAVRDAAKQVYNPRTIENVTAELAKAKSDLELARMMAKTPSQYSDLLAQVRTLEQELQGLKGADLFTLVDDLYVQRAKLDELVEALIKERQNPKRNMDVINALNDEIDQIKTRISKLENQIAQTASGMERIYTIDKPLIGGKGLGLKTDIPTEPIIGGGVSTSKLTFEQLAKGMTATQAAQLFGTGSQVVTAKSIPIPQKSGVEVPETEDPNKYPQIMPTPIETPAIQPTTQPMPQTAPKQAEATQTQMINAVDIGIRPGVTEVTREAVSPMVEPQPKIQPQPKPKGMEPIPPVEEIPPVKEIPPVIPDKRKKKREEWEVEYSVDGTVTWKQGIGWWAIKPPYRGREDMHFFYGYPPPGAQQVEGGAKSAFRSIQAFGGQVPDNLAIDLGIQDIRISNPTGEPGAGEITFTEDTEQAKHWARGKYKTAKSLSEELEETPSRRMVAAASRKTEVYDDYGDIEGRYYLGHRIPDNLDGGV